MTWLLAQGEHLPAILVAIIATVSVCRLLFAQREECESIKAEIADLKTDDSHHMNSVKGAHGRIDSWSQAIHADMVKLFERAERVDCLNGIKTRSNSYRHRPSIDPKRLRRKKRVKK
jgi:uncharacterized coiled-coil DUF342 family protein